MMLNILLINLTKPTASSVKNRAVFQVIYKIIIKSDCRNYSENQPGSMETISNLLDTWN